MMSSLQDSPMLHSQRYLLDASILHEIALVIGIIRSWLPQGQFFEHPDMNNPQYRICAISDSISSLDNHRLITDGVKL